MIKNTTVLILFLSVSFGLTAQVNNDTLEDLEWILGTWERQNVQPGRTQQEIWKKISDKHYQGIGISLQGTDTVFIENLDIRIEGGNVYYIAEVEENPAPVYFKFTSWEKDSFVSENPEHDAPKKIAYFLEGNSMRVKVSWDNGGFEVVFVK